MQSIHKTDILIIGAGLSGLLTFIKLYKDHPELKLTMIDSAPGFNPHKTWSCHESDLPVDSDWIHFYVDKYWKKSKVIFPKFEKIDNSAYLSIKSESFYEKIPSDIKKHIFWNQKILKTIKNNVYTQDTIYQASTIIEASGNNIIPSGHFAYQDFVGYTIKTPLPHGINEPVIMDSHVEQKNGFRFIYSLPWSENEVLIEDTRYHLNKTATFASIEFDLKEYLNQKFPQGYEVVKKEQGSLPLPLSLDYYLKNFPRSSNAIGYRGGFFHGTTGFSLPFAIEIANKIAAQKIIKQETLESLLWREWLIQIKKLKTNVFFNKLIFISAIPNESYKIFQRFYELPQWTREHFYKNQLDFKTLLRIFTPIPPPPIKLASFLLALNKKGSDEHAI